MLDQSLLDTPIEDAAAVRKCVMRRRWAAVVRDITDKAQNVRALQTINWAMPPRANCAWSWNLPVEDWR